MTSRAWLMALPLALFIGLAVFLAGGLTRDPSLLPSAKVGKPLPSFELARLGEPGSRITHEDIKGPALLNVWGVWCPACLIEHPVLLELAKGGVPIYGLNYKDVEETAVNFLRQKGNPYKAVISDTQGSLGFDLGVYGAPETFLIDAEGIIRYRHVGEITADKWRNDLWLRWQEMTGTQSPSGVTP